MGRRRSAKAAEDAWDKAIQQNINRFAEIVEESYVKAGGSNVVAASLHEIVKQNLQWLRMIAVSQDLEAPANVKEVEAEVESHGPETERAG